MAFVEQDVLGLDVAMDDVVPVGVVEGVGHLRGDAHGLVHRQRAFLLKPVAERTVLHDRHHEVEEPARLARVVQRQDVRMIEPCREADLAEEPLPPECLRDASAKHLDCDVALVSEVVREVHGGHAACAEFAFQAIASPEPRKQRRCVRRHRAHSSGMYDSGSPPGSPCRGLAMI
jgi:hypothetical protein